MTKKKAKKTAGTLVVFGKELLEAEVSKGLMSLPPVEKNLFSLAVSQIKDSRKGGDKELKGKRYMITDVAKTLGISQKSNTSGKFYKRIREAVRFLQTKIITFTDRETGDEIDTQYLGSSRWGKNQEWFEMRIPDAFKSALLQLEGDFIQYRLATALSFQSGYAGNLYLLLKKHDYGDHWFEIDLEEFKRQMGIPEGKYKRYADLNRMVIKYANDILKENEECDIFARYIKSNLGKQTTDLKFFIKHKSKERERRANLTPAQKRWVWFEESDRDQREKFWEWLKQFEDYKGFEEPDWEKIPKIKSFNHALEHYLTPRQQELNFL